MTSKYYRINPIPFKETIFYQAICQGQLRKPNTIGSNGSYFPFQKETI